MKSTNLIIKPNSSLEFLYGEINSLERISNVCLDDSFKMKLMGMLKNVNL